MGSSIGRASPDALFVLRESLSTSLSGCGMITHRNEVVGGIGVLALAGIAALGCAERQRPTFPTGFGFGEGPEVTITDPVRDTSFATGVDCPDRRDGI
jgi:hypothetical protein